jgi:hypothetical protein
MDLRHSAPAVERGLTTRSSLSPVRTSCSEAVVRHGDPASHETRQLDRKKSEQKSIANGTPHGLAAPF